MPRTSKRKAHLQQISHLGNESKRQKLDKDTKTKSALLAQQMRDEDFWDEYESYNSESSFDGFNSDQSSSDDSEKEVDDHNNNNNNRWFTTSGWKPLSPWAPLIVLLCHHYVLYLAVYG